MISDYKVSRVTDASGYGVNSNIFSKMIKIDKKGLITFMELNSEVNYKVFLSVYNGYKWFE